MNATPDPTDATPSPPNVGRRVMLTGAAAFAAGVGTGAFTTAEPDTHRDHLAPGADASTAQVGRGGSLVWWSVPTEEKILCLSFDDGPDPTLTPSVLKILEAHDVTATFFLMGFNVVRHPELAKEVAARHHVGSHTFSHRRLSKLTYPEMTDEILRGREQVRRVTGQDAHWFRPPRGELPGYAVRICAKANMDIALWSVRSTVPDGTTHTPPGYAKRITDQLFPGSIIDFHDGIGRATFDPKGHAAEVYTAMRRSEIGGLDDLITRCRDLGYRFVSLDDAWRSFRGVD